MINLQKINKIKTLYIVILILLLLNIPKSILSSENKIIFKINNNVFTLFDLEKRIEYLDFVGSNNNLTKKIIIDDFISANLFFEYYKNLNKKINYENKLEEIYNKILNINNQNNKVFDYKIDKKDILNNIRIDFIRKTVLENILNSNINNLETTNDEIDLLYNLKIKYINFKSKNFLQINKKINNLENKNFENIVNFLKKNNIDFFIKEKEINNIKNIDYRIRENIMANNNFFILENNDDISLIFILKKFVTLDGIVGNLYSVSTDKELNEEFLNCDNLFKLKNYPNIINKEYKLIDLNVDLKNRLISINDYVKYTTNDEIVYIILCNIKFDKEILNNINMNKKINTNINEIENRFINKYSKIYNLIKFYE